MKPYYEEAGITIYHGDCRNVLPTLLDCGDGQTYSADTVIADPPYNVGKNYGSHKDSMTKSDYAAWMNEVLSLCDLAAPEVVYFPGLTNLMTVASDLSKTRLRPVRVLGWHKREFAGDLWTSGPAISWEPIVWASRSEKPRFNKLFGSGGRDFLIVNSVHGNPFRPYHPCPKPMPVMRWLVSLFVPDGGLLIDPCCGTGTSLRAAKDLGRRAIGIEIEERYCEIAAKRLSQGVLDLQEAAV